MTQDSFSKEAALDIANDPLELIKLLSGDTAKRARNEAEVNAVRELLTVQEFAFRTPLQLTVPADWDSPDRKSYAVLHLGVGSVELNTPVKKRRSVSQAFGAPMSSEGVAKNTTIQDDWQPPTGNGTLSNIYTGIPLVSRSTGKQYSVNITVGVQFIDPDLFDGEFAAAPLREAVEREMILVLPPGAQFKTKMLPKVVRERMARNAFQFCNDAVELRWYSELVPGTDAAKHLLRKAAGLEE